MYVEKLETKRVYDNMSGANQFLCVNYANF
jgi:hypothetical protein